jgi:hypothetical protein
MLKHNQFSPNGKHAHRAAASNAIQNSLFKKRYSTAFLLDFSLSPYVMNVFYGHSGNYDGHHRMLVQNAVRVRNRPALVGLGFLLEVSDQDGIRKAF